MELQNIHRTMQQLRLITKYGMTAILCLMTLHCGLLYFGHDSVFIHCLFCFFVLLVALYLSNVFRLCWIHKASVIYSMAVIVCVVMRRHDVFTILDIDINYARLFMFILGLTMISLNVWNTLSKQNFCKK